MNKSSKTILELIESNANSPEISARIHNYWQQSAYREVAKNLGDSELVLRGEDCVEVTSLSEMKLTSFSAIKEWESRWLALLERNRRSSDGTR